MPSAMTRLFVLPLLTLCLALACPLLAAERDSDLIRRENAKEGSRDWQLTRVALQSETGVRAAYIEGYCSKQSVSRRYFVDLPCRGNSNDGR